MVQRLLFILVCVVVGSLGCGGETSSTVDGQCTQCGPGTRCKAGICVLDTSTSGTSNGTTGTTDPCGGTCTSDQSCVAGVCTEVGCANDEACADGTICEAGQCQPGCRFDGQCASGQICQDTLCIEGCRNPTDCPDLTTCRNRVCVPQSCQDDADCGSGGRCADEACTYIGDVDCESDMACGYTWHCSVVRQCIAEQCAAEGDCDNGDWCQEGACQPRETVAGPVMFERHYPETVSEHASGYTNRRMVLTYGYGAGLFDFDGDHDLDLFLGTIPLELGGDLNDGSPACVFTNVSEPGDIRFEPHPDACPLSGSPTSGFGVDLEGDGYDELILQGEGVLKLLRFHPTFEVTDLQDNVPEPLHDCMAGAMIATDINFDGLVDLLVGCQGFADSPNTQNIFLRQTEEGTLVYTSVAELKDTGITLGLGTLDINGDGLLDILAANDSFSLDGIELYRHLGRGTNNVRCPPTEMCDFQTRYFAEGDRAWGSYMGVGNIHIDGLGDHLYLADWGSNLMIRYEDGQPIDAAKDLNIDLGWNEGHPIFAWGVMVDDFDRNGLDDLYITQGPVDFIGPNIAEPPAWEAHRSVMALQTAGGQFTLRNEEAGFEAPNTEDARRTETDRWYSSRAALKADLDGDGLMDILELPLEGVPRFYAELPSAQTSEPRCTLIPRNRFVPGYGVGYAIAAEGETRWMRRDIQGQLRLGAPSSLLSSVSRGTLRFPSGAEVPFDCQGTPGPIVVEEPDWLNMEREDDALLVVINASWLPPSSAIDVALRAPGLVTRRVTVMPQEDGIYRIDIPQQADAIMLNIEGRWLSRWFPL